MKCVHCGGTLPKPEVTEEMRVSVDRDDDCWMVKVNGEYIHHFVYEGDAYGMASRLRRAALTARKEG